MIKLFANTRQSDFITELAKEANGQGVVQVSIESMPAFLNTPIAVRIFEYQIASYPRTIVWNSEDSGILDFLIKQNLATPLSPQLQLPHKNSQPTHSTQPLRLSATAFHQSPLLNENQKDQISPNLDSILERLKEAKQNLAGKNRSKPKPNFTIFARAGILTAVILVFTLVVSLVTAFPTQVYTLEIVPQNSSQNSELILGMTRFNKETLNLEAKTTIPTTGKRSIPSTKATGQIRITNQGSGVVILNTAELRFNFGVSQYSSPSLLNLVNVQLEPESGNSVEITIQSDKEGSSFNLASNVDLDMTTITGAINCPGCRITTVSTINTSNLLNFGFTTQDDLDNLQTQNNQKINYQIVTRINQLSLGPNLNSFNWYRTSNPKSRYDKDLNQESSQVSLTTNNTVEFFYLPIDEAIQFLKQDNSKLIDVQDPKLTKVTGDFQSIKNDELVQLNLNYTGSFYPDIVVDDSNYIGLQSEDIKARYPNVQRIGRRETGLPIPGVTPRVKVDLIKK